MKEKEDTTIRVKCSWCNKDMGEKPGPDNTTHGICDECVERVLSDEVDPIQQELFPNERKDVDST